MKEFPKDDQEQKAIDEIHSNVLQVICRQAGLITHDELEDALLIEEGSKLIELLESTPVEELAKILKIANTAPIQYDPVELATALKHDSAIYRSRIKNDVLVLKPYRRS